MKKVVNRFTSLLLVIVVMVCLAGQTLALPNLDPIITDPIIIPPSILDISDDFTDPAFRECVWYWLGKTGTPGSFMQKDIADRIASGIKTLDIADRQITSLNGIEHFDGLETIYCDENNLTTLPVLPDTIEYLSCTHNQITSLPELPQSLRALGCTDNKLTSLPPLPSGLELLVYSENSVSQLPVLPSGLRQLDCSKNNMQTLPSVPQYLQALACSDNGLTSLPSLPASLLYLDVSNNPIENLPSSLPKLQRLFCSGCLLSTLPALPAELEFLNCEYNYLNVFDDPLKSKLTVIGNKTYVPQYRVQYTGAGITLDIGETNQIGSGDIKQQMSSDGTIWGDVAAIAFNELTFSSSLNAVAKVDSTGVITAVGTGSCTVTVIFSGINSEFTKAMISVIVTDKTFSGSDGTSSGSGSGVDYMSASSWAIPELEQAEQYDLFTDAVKDHLTQDITRAEFCGIAVKLYGALTGSTAEPVAVNPFTDTNDPIILKAYNLGIVNGVAPDKFSPNNNISRQEICVMIFRALKAANPNLNSDVSGVGSFADESQIASWAINEVRFASKNGIMNGTGGNRMDPLDNTQRQVAVILIKRTFESFR